MTTPEEELYVLVRVPGEHATPTEYREVISHYAGPLTALRALQKKKSEDDLGKTRIAKLQFVEEE